MISHSSRVLHAALVAVCGAGMVYGPAQAQTSLTLQLGQPGYYGQISIGNLAPPPVYDRRPVIVRPPTSRYRWNQNALQPVYLRVPRNQARDWRRYCGRYQACNVPVYFVREEWYRNVYSPWVRAERNRQQALDRWRFNSPSAPRVLVAPPGRPYDREDRRDQDDRWRREDHGGREDRWHRDDN
jgi:hypothetical protein